MQMIMLTFFLLQTRCLASENLAYKRPTFENSIEGKITDKTVDGRDFSCVTIEASPDSDSFTPWWSVRLDGIYYIKTVTVFYNPNYSRDEHHYENFIIFASVDSYKYLIKCSTVNHKMSSVLSVDYVNVTCAENTYGNLVHIIKSRGQRSNTMSICEVYVYGEVNLDKITLSYKKTTEQSGVLFNDLSHLAVDGKLETCTRVRSSSEDAWWRVTLDDIFAISSVYIYANPYDNDAHMGNVYIYISNDVNMLKQQLCHSIFVNRKTIGGYLNFTCSNHVAGKFVAIMKIGGDYPKHMFLCEVFVIQKPDTTDCSDDGIKCSSPSMCIPNVNICDKVKQCNDGSDELNCDCLSYQYKCDEGLCIHNDWLCDGTKDCPKGDDEELALCLCRRDQFKCLKHRQCIDNSKRCDGIVDCSDSSDEFHCLDIDKWYFKARDFLKGIYQGEYNYYICSTFWTDANSFKACEHMGSGFLQSTQFSPLHSSLVDSHILEIKSYRLPIHEYTPIMNWFEKRNVCSSGLFVKVECSNLLDQGCGLRGYPESFLQYIINGDVAERGAWPWHVQVIVRQSKVCGGSILNYHWILTAAHCISDVNNISMVKVKYGTNIRNDPGVEGRGVTTFAVHPNYTEYFSLDDIALIKLEHPIMFNVFTKPICLPRKHYNDTKLKSYRYCIITGFGSVDRAYGSRKPERLRQGRMDLMTNEECLRNLRNDTSDDYDSNLATNKLVCAGSIPTTFGINSCRGDSGGPLVCKNENGVWTQIGIMMSYYKGRIAEHCSNSIFARVSHHLDFIGYVIYN